MAARGHASLSRRAARGAGVARASLVALAAIGLVGCAEDPYTPQGGADLAMPVPPRMVAGPPGWVGLPGDRLGPLPTQTGVRLGYFQTSEACSQCHSTAEGSPALRDAAGRDVSPVGYRASMMAHAARDPYYLATFSHELALRPGATAVIEKTCTRCHSPAADVVLGMAGKHVTFGGLTADASPESSLARDGIGCVLCHQIRSDGLGTAASFGGGFTLSGTTIYGPYQDPLVEPMQFFVSYTPAYGAHFGKSELCATCHTVITRAIDDAGNAVGPPFYEQATFLEWQNSGHTATPCQGCHTPSTDEDGATITTPIARPPGYTVGPRTPVARHLFNGANGYVLRLLADQASWSGSATPAAELLAQAARDDASVTGAAALKISRAVREGGSVAIDVEVENKAGHKLPTGYPSRRAFLHLTVSGTGGRVLFESGGTDEHGRIVDGRAGLVDVPGELHPHRDQITRDDEVQIYEAVPSDGSGGVATSVTDARRYLKDNRLLPLGYQRTGPNAAITAPVGVDGDPTFGSTDRVRYLVAAPAEPLTITVELVYQTLRPTDLEALAAQPTDTSRRFFDMVATRAPRPLALARAQATLP